MNEWCAVKTTEKSSFLIKNTVKGSTKVVLKDNFSFQNWDAMGIFALQCRMPRKCAVRVVSLVFTQNISIEFTDDNFLTHANTDIEKSISF